MTQFRTFQDKGVLVSQRTADSNGGCCNQHRGTQCTLLRSDTLCSASIGTLFIYNRRRVFASNWYIFSSNNFSQNEDSVKSNKIISMISISSLYTTKISECFLMKCKSQEKDQDGKSRITIWIGNQIHAPSIQCNMTLKTAFAVYNVMQWPKHQQG